jgi:hypothetical protein
MAGLAALEFEWSCARLLTGSGCGIASLGRSLQGGSGEAVRSIDSFELEPTGGGNDYVITLRVTKRTAAANLSSMLTCTLKGVATEVISVAIVQMGVSPINPDDPLILTVMVEEDAPTKAARAAGNASSPPQVEVCARDCSQSPADRSSIALLFASPPPCLAAYYFAVLGNKTQRRMRASNLRGPRPPTLPPMSASRARNACARPRTARAQTNVQWELLSRNLDLDRNGTLLSERTGGSLVVGSNVMEPEVIYSFQVSVELAAVAGNGRGQRRRVQAAGSSWISVQVRVFLYVLGVCAFVFCTRTWQAACIALPL